MKQISKEFTKINITILITLIFVLIPVFMTSALNIDNPLGTTSDITTLVENIINFLRDIGWVIAPIIIVYAGYLYMTSAGNEEKIKTAQKALVWALVGLAVLLIASGVPAIIKQFLYGEEESSETGSGSGGGT